MTSRPRPNTDLAAVTAAIHPDGRIEITGADDAAQGRVFAWLVDQIQDARSPAAIVAPPADWTEEDLERFRAWWHDTTTDRVRLLESSPVFAAPWTQELADAAFRVYPTESGLRTETNSDGCFGVPLPKNVTVDTSALGTGNVTVSTDGSVAITARGEQYGNVTIRAVDPLLIDPDAQGWMP